MYLWHTGHNCSGVITPKATVVDCFQNVSLTYRTQHQTFVFTFCFCCGLLSECIFDIPDTTGHIVKVSVDCCGLLSECIFDIPDTTFSLMARSCSLLWIAFRMYLWHTGHNTWASFTMMITVVDCFQNVSLTYRTQPHGLYTVDLNGCGLLSECIFDIPDTTT